MFPFNLFLQPDPYHRRKVFWLMLAAVLTSGMFLGLLVSQIRAQGFVSVDTGQAISTLILFTLLWFIARTLFHLAFPTHDDPRI